MKFFHYFFSFIFFSSSFSVIPFQMNQNKELSFEEQIEQGGDFNWKEMSDAQLALFIIHMVQELKLHDIPEFLEHPVLDCYLGLKEGKKYSREQLIDIAQKIMIYAKRSCSKLSEVLTKVCLVLEYTQQLLKDFDYTWTMIDAIASISDLNAQTALLCEKFNQTWTILGDQTNLLGSITQTLFVLNTDLVSNFNATWTVLSEIEQGIDCLKTDFEYTWTILDSIKSKITTTLIINIDLAGVFTALNSMQNVMIEDFNQTWTAVAAVNTTVNNISSAIFSTQTVMISDFNQTWTILDCIKTEVTNVFTALNAQTNLIVDDFNYTWTILANCQTPTVLVQADFSGVFTALNAQKTVITNDFNYTWTILDCLQSRVDDVVMTTSEFYCQLNDTQTIMIADFNYTWTILGSSFNSIYTAFAANFACDPISISTPTTITAAGVYCLSQDINGAIVIAANNVVLDLNGHQVSGGSFALSATGVSNVEIKNGFISSAVNTGLYVSTCNNVIVSDVSFSSSPTGVYVETTTCVRLQNIVVQSHTKKPVAFLNVNTLFIDDLIAQSNTVSASPTSTVVGFVNCSVCAINNLFVANNGNLAGGPSELVAVGVLGANNMTFNQSQINLNAASGAVNLKGIAIENVQDLVINQTMVNNNSAQGNVEDIFVRGSQKITFVDVQASNNTAIGFCRGIVFDLLGTVSCQDIVLLRCQISQNVSTGSFTNGLFANAVSRLLMQNSASNSNTGSGGTSGGILLSGCQDCTLVGVSTNSNTASSGNGFGIQANNCVRVQVKGCQANANTGLLTSFGFSFVGQNSLSNPTLDLIVDQCVAQTNGLTGATSYGVYVETYTKVAVQNTVASDNKATTLAAGIRFFGVDRSSIANSIAQRNIAATANGIQLTSCRECSIERNITKSNTTYGIVDVPIGQTNVFFNNQAQANGTLGTFGVNNLNITGPITSYNPTTGGFSPVPTAFDNVNVILP